MADDVRRTASSISASSLPINPPGNGKRSTHPHFDADAEEKEGLEDGEKSERSGKASRNFRARESFLIPDRVTVVLEHLDGFGLGASSSFLSYTEIEKRARAGGRKRKLTYALATLMMIIILVILSVGLYQMALACIADLKWNNVLSSKQPFHNINTKSTRQNETDRVFSGKWIKDVPVLASNFGKSCEREGHHGPNGQQPHPAPAPPKTKQATHGEKALVIDKDGLKKPVVLDLCLIGLLVCLIASGFFLIILLCVRREDSFKKQWIGWGFIGALSLAMAYVYFGSAFWLSSRSFVNARIVLESEKHHEMLMMKVSSEHNRNSQPGEEKVFCIIQTCDDPEEERAKQLLQIVKACVYNTIHMNKRDPCHCFSHSVPQGIKLEGRWYSRDDLEALSFCSKDKTKKIGLICLTAAGFLALLLMWLYSWADKCSAFRDGREHKKTKQQALRKVTAIQGISERGENEIPEEMRMTDPTMWFGRKTGVHTDEPSPFGAGALQLDFAADHQLGPVTTGVIRRSSFNMDNHNPLMIGNRTKKFVIHPPRASERHSKDSLGHKHHDHSNHGVAHKILHPLRRSHSKLGINEESGAEKGATWFRKEDDEPPE